VLPEGYEHEGIGFYVMRDDGEISLEDIVTQVRPPPAPAPDRTPYPDPNPNP